MSNAQQMAKMQAGKQGNSEGIQGGKKNLFMITQVVNTMMFLWLHFHTTSAKITEIEGVQQITYGLYFPDYGSMAVGFACLNLLGFLIVKFTPKVEVST